MITMNEQALISLFQTYIAAFKQYDLAVLQKCYAMPCSLHTPEKIAYLASEHDFEQEFIDIFTVLQHANTQEIQITKASYDQSIHGLINVCIDWAFIDDSGEVFADFCAFYQLVDVKLGYKIVSVVSHELSNSVALKNDLIITQK
ncbi:hypothetical protein AADZ91_15220 [Colwelliaceae bacterium 6441]